MGLFSWLFQHDQREEEREIADRYASPLAHDWRDLGPIGRSADNGVAHQEAFALHRTGLATSAGSGMDHDLGDDYWSDRQGPAINPATGLPMLDDVVDVHHNMYGVSEDIGGMSVGMESFGNMGGIDDQW